jgi:hypothetical protein
MVCNGEKHLQNVTSICMYFITDTFSTKIISVKQYVYLVVGRCSRVYNL